MLNDFIEKALAQIDDLAELKVTLVALRLLDGKQSVTASVTEREMLVHAVVQSMSMPELTMRFALQKALSRGTLIEAQVGEGVRYFANNEASRRIIETIDSPNNVGRGGFEVRPYEAIAKEIERLELVEAYALTSKDRALLDEWQARGYSIDEMKSAVRLALHDPRPKGAPPRRLRPIEAILTKQPPQTPSNYYETVFGDKTPLEPVIMFRALVHRKPNGHEFALIESAIEIFGVQAVCSGLKRIAKDQQIEMESLVPLLAEEDEVSLNYERGRADVNIAVRDLLRMYEDTIGILPTEYVARDIKSIYDSDVKDLMTWRKVFEYAAAQKKSRWEYIRKLLLNPSPNLFVPQPVNQTAAFVYEQYRRRIDSILPATVAQEINSLATQETDTILWERAMQAAERANVLNWNYIRATVIQQSSVLGGENESTKQQQRVGQQARSGGRKAKTDYTTEELATAEKRAEQYLAAIEERKARRKQSRPK